MQQRVASALIYKGSLESKTAFYATETDKKAKKVVEIDGLPSTLIEGEKFSAKHKDSSSFFWIRDEISLAPSSVFSALLDRFLG